MILAPTMVILILMAEGEPSLISDILRLMLGWSHAAVRRQNIPIIQAEQDEMGLTHAAVGRELAAAWQIPEQLIEAIAHHHKPGASDRDSELASLIHVADVLCRNAGVGSGGDDLVPVVDGFALEKLRLQPDQLLEWEGDILKELEKDRAFLAAIA